MLTTTPRGHHRYILEVALEEFSEVTGSELAAILPSSSHSQLQSQWRAGNQNIRKFFPKIFGNFPFVFTFHILLTALISHNQLIRIIFTMVVRKTNTVGFRKHSM